MVVLIIAAEALTMVACVKIFGMGEGATLCAVLSVLCIILAIALYFDDERNDISKKKILKQMPQDDIDSVPHCPYCFSGNTFMDEQGNCLCFDCNAHWREENAT